MVKFIQNDINCFFLVKRTSFVRNLANLELCVVFFVMFFFVMGVRIIMFWNRVGIAAVQLKLQGRYEMFVQSLGKLDIYITLPLERERIVSSLY